MSETFEMQYKDDIQARMVNELNKINDKASFEGSFGRDLVNANSVEFENAYAEMNLIIQAAYGTTAWGKYLTNIAAEFGVTRKAATPSIVELSIFGTANTVVPKGSLFSTEDGATVFLTDKDVTLDAQGKGAVSITSKATGASANVAAGAVNHIPASIYGVSSVTNAEATHDGADEEDDETLRTRYLEYVREPATSGNAYHYKHWALSCSGVGDVKVIPLAKGNGTVRVLIIGADKKPCSDEVVAKTKEYIDSVKPIGATVYVDTPTYLNISVSATVYPTKDTYQYAIKAAIEEYFIQTGFGTGEAVSIAQIGRIMLETGTISDYSGLKINDAQSNVSLPVDQLPALSTINLTSGG